MKKHLFFLLVFLCPIFIFSQNVGIGTSNPLMKLHVTNSDSSVLLLLENAQALDIGVNTSMYFKTGNGGYPYTGGIKTIGTGPNTARLGLFTYAATSPNGLLERMSLLDNGNVGIGLLTPSTKLEVEGGIKTDSMEVTSFLELSGYNYLGGSDDGVIMSNPNKVGSDIFLVANGSIIFEFDKNNNNDGSFEIKDGSGATKFSVGNDGLVTVVGVIQNVSDPVSAQDAATKAYVDGEISSLPTITTYSVGDFAQGGIVFWVDETGQHGLVCAKSDQSSGIRWNAGNYGNTQAKGDGPYSGEANTAIIIAAQVAIGDDGSTYAARICNELQITEGGTTYGDWYLPSKYELDLMYNDKATIDATALANGGVGFAANRYWSSTEFDFFSVWTQNFLNGPQTTSSKGSSSSLSDVRAVRAF